MGIIRAVASSVSDVAGEQWKEFFYCDSLPENILLVRGQKRVSEKSANNRKDGGVITPGSIIAVADGQGAIAVSQGKVIAYYGEPGEHIYENPEQPGGVKGFLKETGNRISFGGGVQTTQQRIYYFNTKEIMGIPFSGEIPTTLLTGDFQSGLFISGVFSYRVCDPTVFYKMVTGNVSLRYDRYRLNEQLVTELKAALNQIVAETDFFRPSDMGRHTYDLITGLMAVLNESWQNKRGIEIVRIAFNGGAFSGAGAIAQIQTVRVFDETSGSREPCPAWKCSCGTISNGRFCPECGLPKTDEWICTCGRKNNGNYCEECGKARMP